MAARSLLIKAGKLTLSSSSSSSHPLLAVKRTSSLLRPLIPASSSADIPCFSLAAETAARPSLRPDHDPRRMEFSDRPDFELGLDFEHWQVYLGGFHSGFTIGEIVDTCVGKAVTRDDIIDTYVKTLAMVVGSEEEARMKIYSVWTRKFFGFGVLASEELAYKIKELPRVIVVAPDSYMFPETKDYGGEPFINGQALPFDTKYYLPFIHRSPFIEFLRVVVGPDTRNQETLKCLLIECSRRGTKWNRMKGKLKTIGILILNGLRERFLGSGKLGFILLCIKDK